MCRITNLNCSHGCTSNAPTLILEHVMNLQDRHADADSNGNSKGNANPDADLALCIDIKRKPTPCYVARPS
jgi:hypothetical protein